jgi:DivIVA domain-containing protein
VDLPSFSGRATVALLLGYLVLVGGAMTLGEAAGWWSWDDRLVLLAVAAPYWLAVQGVDLVRGSRAGRSAGAGRAGPALAGAASASVGHDGVPVTADEVLNVQFTSTQLREGYDQDAVDEFLDRVVHTLRALADGTVPPTVPGTGAVTRADVLAVTFPATRFREGYDQDEVDDLLDRVAEALGTGTETPRASGAPAGPTGAGTLHVGTPAVATPVVASPVVASPAVPSPVVPTPQVIHEGARGLRRWTRDRTGRRP